MYQYVDIMHFHFSIPLQKVWEGSEVCTVEETLSRVTGIKFGVGLSTRAADSWADQRDIRCLLK